MQRSTPILTQISQQMCPILCVVWPP